MDTKQTGRITRGTRIRVLQGSCLRWGVFLEAKGELVKVIMDREQWVHQSNVYPYN